MERERQELNRSVELSRHQPLLKTEAGSRGTPRGRRQVGECAGGAAAECAAVCCCVPFAAVNLLVLATYKVPASLCRKAWHKKRRQSVTNIQAKGLLYLRPGSADQTCGEGYVSPPAVSAWVAVAALSEDETKNENREINEYVEMEGIWPQIHGAGFWRSLSQRDD